MKKDPSFWPSAVVAAFATAVASALPAAPAVDVSAYAQARLTPVSQKSFEDLRDLTDQRIAEIRATPDIVPPSGATVYYASTKSGSSWGGWFNGGTKDNPWTSLSQVNNAPSGSYVLFERGSVFRGQLQPNNSNVTYSAYGTGPKPRIYASPADGADSSKWTKASGTSNVWQYYIGNSDVGTIVFDGGREHAIKIVPYYHTNATAAVKFTQQYTGEPFTNGYKDLAHDLHFWHDYTSDSVFKPHSKGTGNIYLYSAKGNPGSRFKSIEFCIKKHAINVGYKENMHIDNLCIKYTGAHGISGSDDKNPNPLKKLKVTNCEFGWIGGSIQCENAAGGPTRYGNGVEIYGGCDDFVVSNCYVYQVYDAAITQQFGLQSSSQTMNQKNIRYVNNVVENCNYSIEYFLSKVATNNTSLIQNFLIADNIMWDAGRGFCEQRPNHDQAAHIKSWADQKTCNRAKGYVVRDNVFACGRDMLIQIHSRRMNQDGSDSMPTTMSGNVFIGTKGQALGTVSQNTIVNLNYTDAGVAKLCERYPENYFFTEPKRKYSLWALPPSPHVER